MNSVRCPKCYWRYIQRVDKDFYICTMCDNTFPAQELYDEWFLNLLLRHFDGRSIYIDDEDPFK